MHTCFTNCQRVDIGRPQWLTLLYSLFSRWFLVLAVIMLLLPAAVIQAEEPQPVNQPDKVITRLPGSRAAGARWVEPYNASGPKILDTRRSSPPAVQDSPRSGPDSVGASDTVRSDSSGFVLYADQYLLGTRFRKFYRPRPYYPYGLYGFKPYGTRRSWRGFRTGRGYISSGRGFRKGRSGFRKHHGAPGRGLKGGGFRRR